MSAPYRLDAATPVAVIGAGSMGAGIAQLAAQCGHSVRLLDTQPGAAQRALERIGADLDVAVQKGRMDAMGRDAVLARIATPGELVGLAGCGLAVEAIVEKLEPKKSLFRDLEAVLGPAAVLATNTSSISISAVAQGLEHPGRVVGWHFFNPVTRMKLVEVIPGVETDPDLVDAMHALTKAWGKTAVAAPNAPGFIVNRVARPYYAEGLRLLAERIAPAESIDRLLREAGGFAMGPFELIDLIGADVNLSVTESVFAATAWDARYAPNILQQELVRAGRHGRKTGRGFYSYAPGARPPVAPTVVPAPGTGMQVAAASVLTLLAPLVDRLRAAGIRLTDDGALAPDTLRFGDAVLAVTDGRTLGARRAAGTGGHADAMPAALLDLARAYDTTTVVGAAGPDEVLGRFAAVLQPAGVAVIPLADVAGLVVMRTIACIVNEAADLMTWTGTTAADIDTSMRLGMAYTQGPLAWADAVGSARLAAVLTHLQAHYGDSRYRRAPRLSAAEHAQERFHG